jgi:hypothetical protein
MIRARTRAYLVAGAVILAAIALLIAVTARSPEPLAPKPPDERPTLLLLTSLPLMFGEGFSLQDTGSPAMKALGARYRVLPISVTDPAELQKGKLLLMAHPLAQPAEDLVALDRWVRGGGRVMLLADPSLEWPSKRPLGDPMRPPPMFTDTGLLSHWGLRLDSPDEGGIAREKLAGFDVVTRSPGRLEGSCDISPRGFVARCRIGKGEAIVVADADFLDVGGLGSGARHNLDALFSELASLEHR